MGYVEKTGEYMSAHNYGKYYWRIVMYDSDDIFIMADDVEIDLCGALVFVHDKGEKEQTVTFVAAPDTWKQCYAASVIDGSAVAVEHWDKSG